MSVTQKEQKNVRALLTVKGRKQQGRFVAEGVRLLEEAIRQNYLPEKLYYSDHLLTERGRELINKCAQAGFRLIEASARQMAQMSEVKSSQGLLAVFKRSDQTLGESFDGSCRRILLCDNISDPGNLGTLLRSARAFGFETVILSGRPTDCSAPKVVRASAGAIFGLKIIPAQYDSIRKFAQLKRATLIASDLNADESLDLNATMTDPLILAVGSEADGVGPEIVAMSDQRIRIKHEAGVESLNAAAAGSILMYMIYSNDRG
ncbi:MAG: RNA methyltransferase [bacterium]|nr:RNA methyltransferase [bacterium]